MIKSSAAIGKFWRGGDIIFKLNQKDRRTFFHSAVGIAAMAGIGLLPAPYPVTVLGMKIVGILIGMVYLWITVDTLWPSILGLVAIMISGYGTPEEILAASFGNTYTVMTLFMMAFCGVIEQNKINEYIACWFLERKIMDGRPWVFTFIWFLTAAILAMLCHALMAVFFLWSVLYHLSDTLEIRKGDAWLSSMLVGTVFSAMIAQVIFPFKDMGLFMVGSFESISGLSMPAAPYMLVQSVTCICCILFYMLLMRFVFHVNIAPLKKIQTSSLKREELPPMSPLQRLLLALLFVLIFSLCIPAFFATDFLLVTFLKKLGMTGIIMLFFAALCLIRVEGKPLVDFQELAQKRISWNLIFLIAVALCTSTALTDDSTGIKEFLSITCSPAFEGKSAFAFTAILTGATLILTNAANNGVVGILFLTISAIFSVQIEGADVLLLATLVTFCVTDALVLPSASIYGAVLHGNSQWLTKREIIQYTTAAILASYMVIMLVSYPLGTLVF